MARCQPGNVDRFVLLAAQFADLGLHRQQDLARHVVDVAQHRAAVGAAGLDVSLQQRQRGLGDFG
jgi:hypothetical protein